MQLGPLPVLAGGEDNYPLPRLKAHFRQSPAQLIFPVRQGPAGDVHRLVALVPQLYPVGKVPVLVPEDSAVLLHEFAYHYLARSPAQFLRGRAGRGRGDGRRRRRFRGCPAAFSQQQRRCKSYYNHRCRRGGKGCQGFFVHGCSSAQKYIVLYLVFPFSSMSPGPVRRGFKAPQSFGAGPRENLSGRKNVKNS